MGKNKALAHHTSTYFQTRRDMLFFWRSNRNHYLLVLVMRALAMSIHVRTYRNSMMKRTTTVRSYLPRYHGDYFYSKFYLFWDKI